MWSPKMGRSDSTVTSEEPVKSLWCAKSPLILPVSQKAPFSNPMFIDEETEVSQGQAIKHIRLSPTCVPAFPYTCLVASHCLSSLFSKGWRDHRGNITSYRGHLVSTGLPRDVVYLYHLDEAMFAKSLPREIQCSPFSALLEKQVTKHCLSPKGRDRTLFHHSWRWEKLPEGLGLL